MRIIFDLQACQTYARFHGIGRYSLALAKAIANNMNPNDIWVLLNDKFPDVIPSIRYAFNGLVPVNNIVIMSIPASITADKQENKWRTHAAEMIRSDVIREINPDILHVFSAVEGWSENVATSSVALQSGVINIATVYDLIPLLRQGEYLTDEAFKGFYLSKIESLKNYDVLLSISEATKIELLSELELNADHVVNISAAVENKFEVIDISAKEQSEFLVHYGISKPFILYTPSGFDSRKNIEKLIEAYVDLTPSVRSNYQLVIPGRITSEQLCYFSKLCSGFEVESGEIIFTGFVPDDDLVKLYNLCEIFVYPSLHEGFGLPVLEAMACGAPTIGSNCSSIPEVIGRDDALFDPTSVISIKAAIYKTLSNGEFRQSLCESGLARATKFDWDVSATKVIEVYNRYYQKHLMGKKCGSATIHNDELLDAIAKPIEGRFPDDDDLISTAFCIAENRKAHLASPQFFVDVSVIVQGDAKSGIQRVVRSILMELMDNPPGGYAIKPICFKQGRYYTANKYYNQLLGRSVRNVVDGLIEYNRGDIYLSLDLNFRAPEDTQPLLERMNRLGVEIYFTVYDLLLVQHPEWWPEGVAQHFENWLECVTELATGVACISKAVSIEFDEWVNNNSSNRIEPIRNSYFHLGADIINSAPSKGMPSDADDVLNVLSSKISFLMVGTIEPRKGHFQTLSAFETLWGEGGEVNLVIVGKEGWLVDELIGRIKTHKEFGRKLFWLNGISDEFLGKIYLSSSCLIFASKGEGFGLPLIEAAQNDLPIIARDIPVFREIAGEHACYFSGNDSEALSTSIKNWIALYSENKHPQSSKIPCISWRQSAAELLSACGVGK